MLFDAGSGGSGLGAILVLGLLILIVSWYFLYSYFLYKIAKKTDTNFTWLSFIPFANLVYPLYIAKFQWWLIVICVLCSFAPQQAQIVNLVSAVGYVYAFVKIAQQLRRPAWWGVIMIISPINLIVMWFMAFRDAPQVESQVASPPAPVNT